MPILIMQLIEPDTLGEAFTANTWLLADDKSTLAQGRRIEVAQVSSWVQEHSAQSLSSKKSNVQKNGANNTGLQKSLSTMAKLELVALIPSWRAHVRLLTVNKGQAKYLDETIPVLMESQLGQSIEDTHFVSKLIGEDQVLVSAVSRDQMSIWQSLIADIDAVKKSVIAPQALLHDAFDDEVDVISFLDDVYRCEKGHIFSVPPLLQARSNAISTTLGVDFFVGVLSQWKSWQGVSLLCGDFAIKSTHRSSSALLKVGLGVVIAGLLMTCVGLSYQASVNQAQAAYIEKEGKAAFLSLAPDEGQVISLRRQIEGRLRTIASTKGSKDMMYSPYSVLSKIEEAKKQTSGDHSPDLIAYRDGVYILEWVAKDQETLDRLRESLKKVKLDTYLDQVILKDKQYVGSYRIQGAL